MVKVYKFFAYFTLFMLALIYFMPKLNLYYAFEKELQNYKVVFEEASKEDSGFALKLKGVEVFYDSISVAKVKDVKLNIFVIYNSLNIDDIDLAGLASSFVPTKIKEVDVVYTIFNPLNITLKSDGEFGEADVRLNLYDRDINIILKPSKLMLQRYRPTLNNFKKAENGEYRYVKTF
jgi:hypothetical protein